MIDRPIPVGTPIMRARCLSSGLSVVVMGGAVVAGGLADIVTTVDVDVR